MEKEVLKQKFTAFLKSKKCLAAFKENNRKSQHKQRETAFDLLISKYHNSPKNLMWSAFGWSGTPQGHKFWSGICRDWEKTL